MNNHHTLVFMLNQLISCIENASIRSFTWQMADSASAAWERPASRAHHMPDERMKYGNLLHSVRVASLCKLISSAVVVDLGSKGTKAEVKRCSGDVLLSAAILHDVCRYGLFGVSSASQPDHPELVRQYATTHHFTCDHFDDIMDVVEAHMGKWSVPPVQLAISARTALHLADCIIARWAEVMPKGNTEDTID